DRYRDVAAGLGERALAERLRVRIRVGPAERRGPGAARLDHPVLDPLGAALLGLRGEQRYPGGAELAARLGAEAAEGFGASAVCFRIRPGAAGGVDLGAPVDVEEERAVGEHLLGCGPPPVTGDVAGRHRDEVG